MKGFSLIEMLVYLGLLSLLLTGSIASTYTIAASATKYRAVTVLERDGRFMLHALRKQLQESNGALSQSTLESLTAYTVSEVRIEEGGVGTEEDPEYTDLSFTLGHATEGASLVRMFRTTFYPHAP